jgi:mRNA interferase HigB
MLAGTISYRLTMRVISRRTLRQFWEVHPNAKPGLLLWYERCERGQFFTFNDFRQTFRSADLVGNFIVFNIAGNNFRLIVYVDFEAQLIFVRDILTHAEYDKENWKNDSWYQSS